MADEATTGTTSSSDTPTTNTDSGTAGGDTSTSTTATDDRRSPDTATTTSTDGTDTDPGDDIEKWKALARKHEAKAKSNAEKAKRLDELEERNKTEEQRRAEALDKANQERAEALAAAARLRAALKFGLSLDDLDLLGSGTPEQIEERAERLAKRLGPAKGRATDPNVGHAGTGKQDPDAWLRDVAAGRR